MAVVNETSDLYRDALAGGAVPDPQAVAGRVRVATGKLTNAADDSNGSTYKICSVPADAILHEDTIFDVQNWGFAAVRIGTLDDVDALVSAAKTAANSQSPRVFGDANHGKRLWELLGLPSQPAGYITLYAHAVADATGAGDMPFRVVWIGP